jgi:ssDNA-binding Zn-finger/Zn-ribbon topoisomerase 1
MPSKDTIQYYIDNKEAIKATSKEYYEANKGKHRCKYCNKALSSKFSMKRHMKTCVDKPV